MNLWDIVILAAVAGCAAFAVLRLKKNKRPGCSCGCSSCGESCPSRKK